MLIVTDNHLSFDFECSKKLKKLQTVSQENKYKIHRNAVIQFVKNKNAVDIFAWLSTESGPSNLIFEQHVPYISHQRYSIKYNFDKWSETVRFSIDNHTNHNWIFNPTNESEDHKYVYRCITHEDPTKAKKELDGLKRHKLVRTVWSNFDGCYTHLCEACNYVDNGKRSSYMACTHGRVFDAGVSDRSDKNFDKMFSYNGRWYNKRPSWEWSKKKFYNREEWTKVNEELGYGPTFYKDWKNSTECEDPNNFEQDWKYCGCYWKDPTGKLFQSEKAPVIGAYERVVSKNYYLHKQGYDFDKIFSNKLNQEDIDELEHIHNEAGGAYRFVDAPNTIMSEELVKEKEKQLKHFSMKDVEECISPGWHNLPLPGSIDCPVCIRTYELEQSCQWINFFQKLRLNLYWRKDMARFNKNKKD